MTNLYDYAYDLEKALRDSAQFQNLKKMYEAVTNDQAAKELFDDFRNVQMGLQQKQMAGYDITEDEVLEAQEIANRAQENEKVLKLMESEQQLSVTITELNNIIMKPLEELYREISGQ